MIIYYFPSILPGFSQAPKKIAIEKSKGSQILKDDRLLFGDGFVLAAAMRSIFREFTVGKAPSDTWKQQKVEIIRISKMAEIKKLDKN